MPDFEPDDTTEIPVYVDPVPLPRERGLRDISLGIVIGVLASLLIVAGTAAGVVITNWPHHAVAADAAATPTAGPSASPSPTGDLRAGQCYRVGNDTDPVGALLTCDAPHNGEVVGIADLGGASDGNNLDDLASRVCAPVFQTYVGTSPDNSSYDMTWIVPDSTAYLAGDHKAICLAQTDKDTTGSAKGAEHGQD